MKTIPPIKPPTVQPAEPPTKPPYNSEEAELLRKLAYEYSLIAGNPKNAENIKLHKAVNDLKQVRPVVLFGPLPWNEMNIDGELTLQCNDKFLQSVEWYFRTNIYRNRHMPADTAIPTYLPVEKVVFTTGTGLDVNEELLITEKESNIRSHRYFDILKTEEDLEKIKMPVITYDHDATMQHLELISDIVGDIIPVKLTGRNFFAAYFWDDIARFRGVETLLMDLYDRPEFMHKIIRRFTDAKISELKQFEELGLFENDPYDLHCTAAHTSSLPGKDYKGGKVTRKDIWGRGMAQIFATVSKEMHEEFDTQYMIETIGQCGLSYYGCCEPLDRKIDIIAKIPNLRKISITPWANVDVAAEAIGKKYVLASKPNPASVAEPVLDKGALRKEIGRILSACRRNSCSCDIVLKDLSTCHHRPQNIFEWEQIVMDMVRNY
ncbi:MAG: hypothetical protein PHG48_03745 [Eubacteriales bacterium]|nr:hypothetical protein [Eubacteriales bacterium]